MLFIIIINVAFFIITYKIHLNYKILIKHNNNVNLSLIHKKIIK